MHENKLRKRGISCVGRKLSRWSKYDGGTRGCSFVFGATKPKEERR
jgi:hypothetical protein